MRKREVEGFYHNPYSHPTPKSSSLDRRECLNIAMRMLKCSSPQLMAPGRGVGGERLSWTMLH